MPSDRAAMLRWLNDIHHHIGMAQGFVQGVEFDDLRTDTMRLYAVVRCREIISEASRRLPAEWKAQRTSIEWVKMAAAGNVYRHDYEDVAPDVVWHTVTHDLLALDEVVTAELARFRQPE